MSERELEMNHWLAVIKDEYREMPCLQLTKAQARRLWGLEPALCDVVLGTLEASRFLRVNSRGCYVLAESEGDIPSSPALASGGQSA